MATITPAAWTIYLYSPLGKVTTSAHAITGYSGNLMFSYDWYLNGGLKSVQYPSGRLVSYNVDDAARTNKVYAPSITYADMTMLGVADAYTPDGRRFQ